MNYMVSRLLLCFGVCGLSFYAMEGSQKIKAQLQQDAFNLFGNWVGIEQPKSQLEIFPLVGTSIESFDELFSAASEGNTPVIKIFCEKYLPLKNHTDSEGYTLTMMAAAGYIAGKDAWKTFAYLVEADVPCSLVFIKWLKEPLEDSDKDIRRKQILKILRQKKYFKKTEEALCFLVPTEPPHIEVIREEPAWTPSFAQMVCLGVVGFVGGYLKMSNQLQGNDDKTSLLASSTSLTKDK